MTMVTMLMMLLLVIMMMMFGDNDSGNYEDHPRVVSLRSWDFQLQLLPSEMFNVYPYQLKGTLQCLPLPQVLFNVQCLCEHYN